MRIKQFFFLFVFFGFFPPCNKGFAQRPVPLNDDVSQYIFSFKEIEYLEDPNESFSIDDVASGRFSHHFKPSPTFSPENYNRSSAYWYRVIVQHRPSKHQWQLEFFDQTIDEIDFYTPLEGKGFVKESFGDNFVFAERPLHHKNFFVKLPDHLEGAHTYYFRIKSRQQANVLLVPKLGHAAFINADGSNVIVVSNADGVGKSFTVKWGEAQLSYFIVAKGVATIIWP